MLVATSLVYVYGVLRNVSRTAPPAFLADFGGIVGCGLPRTVQCGAILAFVSDIARPDGGPPDEVPEEYRPAEDMILNHHRVLKELIAEHTVLPIRFGAVFTGDAAVIEALDRRRQSFDTAFDRINGALEWGLKIFCDREVLTRRLTGRSPEIGDLATEIAGKGEGTAFFLRRRRERLAREEFEEAVGRCLDDTARRLEARARETTAVRIQSPEVHGDPHDMVSNQAYLVARAAQGEFLKEIEDLRVAHGPYGFDYRISGPWPVYSFADGRLADDGNHAA